MEIFQVYLNKTDMNKLWSILMIGPVFSFSIFPLVTNGQSVFRKNKDGAVEYFYCQKNCPEIINGPKVLGIETSKDNEEKSSEQVNFYEQLPTRPILTASAGILPNNGFYFLDKFDEWTQENIFSFGVSTLKVQSLLESASERAAEIRQLEVSGQLTDKLSRELTEKMMNSLEAAAIIVGNQYRSGSNPVKLTQNVIRTTAASINSLDNSFREAGSFFLEDNGKSNVEAKLGSIQFLGVVEDRVWSELFPEDVVIAPDILKMAVQERIAETRSGLDQSSGLISLDNNFIVGGKQLIQNAEESFAQALLLYQNNNFQLAIDLLKQARNNYLFLNSPSIQIDPFIFTELEPEKRIKEMLSIVQKKGYIDDEQSKEALAEAIANLKTLKDKSSEEETK